MVCEADEPIDQTRLGQVNRLVNVELSNPALALMVTCGKNAPYTTPITAFSWASVRSAAAMSRRRSTSCPGTPVGIEGGVKTIGFTGMEKSVAILPVNIAIACSYCPRNNATFVAAACAASSVVLASATEM